MLDQQVVRAALKSFKNLFSATNPSTSSLSPSSYYLRLLIGPAQPPRLNESSWKDPGVVILLLEWRAALVVREHAQTSADPDATVNQRVSKAVTEAFIAGQVGDIIKTLLLPSHEAEAVRALYILVTIHLAPRDPRSLTQVTSICSQWSREGSLIFSLLGCYRLVMQAQALVTLLVPSA